MRTWIFIKGILLLLILTASTEIYAQDEEVSSDLMERSNIKGPLEFKGTVKELSKKLKGAIVTLSESADGSHENLTEIVKTTTPGSGQFEFKLEINKFYVLSIEKGGYTTKKIDIDTDVTLAREKYTSVPKFEFIVDMVKDLDGLAFSGSVASVFYQIKLNKFDYQLDYSKEEMEDEERELRERLEKERLAQLAFEKKQQLEESAKLLLDKENATAQELVKAAITVGDGNKTETIKGFIAVFPEVDTLRSKKAEVMYASLLEERKRVNSTDSEIDFLAIFNSAKSLETEIEEAAEEERKAKADELRKKREETLRKQEEAMAIQQQAIEVESREKLESAIAAEERRRKEQAKERQDKVYYAIFESNGDAEIAIKNLVKTYPRGDSYAEEKAKAIYAAYEKRRLTGSTLSNIDFGKLFEAADVAEQAAIKEEIDADNAKQTFRLEAFQQQEEQKERERQEKVFFKIEDGLKSSPSDEASQLKVFEEAFPKSDEHRRAKAQAMFEQYQSQKEALSTIERTIALVPKDKKTQYELFFNALPPETKNRSEVAQKMYDSYVSTVAFQKQGNSSAQLAEEQIVMESLPADLPGKEALSKEIFKQGSAVSESGNSTKQRQIQAIADNLPVSLKNKNQVAEQVYDQYVQKKQVQGGSGTVSLDFASLFNAADKAGVSAAAEAKREKALEKQKEQELLEAKRSEVREQKRKLAEEAEKAAVDIRKVELSKAKSKKDKALADALEKGQGDRDKAIAALEKVLPKTADSELDRFRAESVYDTYLKEKANNSGGAVDFGVLWTAADRAELDMLEKKFQAKEAERAEELAKYEEQRTEKAISIAEAKKEEAKNQAEEAELAYEKTVHRVETQKQERLAAEQKAKQEGERRLAMEKAKREAIEKERAEQELAIVEKERQERLAREKKEADRLASIEAERLRKEQEAAEQEAAEQLALLDKQRQEAEEAKRKEEQRLALEEQKRKEAQEKAEREAELAAARSAQEARKAEEKRVENERKEQERLAREAEKAEQERLALLEKQKNEAAEAERKKLEEEEKARKEAELAATKAAEDAKKAEEKRLEQERKERVRLAQEEQKRLEAEEKAKREAELAAVKEAEDAKKAEEKRLEQERKERERLALEEQKRLEAEEKAKREAELAAAKAEEEARLAEQRRLEELAQQKAEEAEQEKRSRYQSLVTSGDAALEKKEFRSAQKSYADALALYPYDKPASKKLETASAEVDRLDREAAEQLALDEKYSKLIEEGDNQLAQNNYDAALDKFGQASELKPAEQEPKQKIRNIDRTLEQLAAEEKAKQDAERKYLLTLDEGAKAFTSGDLNLAKNKYESAALMKPEESLPKEKLNEIAAREEEIALEKEKEQKRQEEAKRKYEEQLALEAERKEQERQARIEALGLADEAAEQKELTEAQIEKARIEKYEKLKESLEETDLNAEEKRSEFLSELAKIYPQGITKETVQGKNFVLLRHVINDNNVVTIYERKTWDWGGVFYFKDADIAITEAIYQLEIGKYK